MPSPWHMFAYLFGALVGTIATACILLSAYYRWLHNNSDDPPGRNKRPR